jgi:heme exporter protein C
LVLLFLYLGYMALRAAYDNPTQADRASAIIAIVGVINVPIIKFSVDWWNTLHQPATISKMDNPSITADMLWPLLVMILAFNLYYGAVLLNRLRTEILNRERNARWLPELL